MTTIEGLDPERATDWANAFCDSGGSQCGICTPGIILRFDALRHPETAKPPESTPSLDAVNQALLAHVCRCTGWQTIIEAWNAYGKEPIEGRDLAAASTRATIEGRSPQIVGPEVALGQGGFAADTVPAGALVAVADGEGGWATGDTLTQARSAAQRVQGRRTTAAHTWPIDVPQGNWDATLRTTWVEPGYVETDASWCEPGGSPASVLANGGAFGAKQVSELPAVAAQLANDHDRAVLVLGSREDITRSGPKRPPLAGGVKADGTGVIRVADTPGIAEAIAFAAPEVTVELVAIEGPPTTSSARAAGWAEAAILLAGARGHAGPITSPSGATAQATIGPNSIKVEVSCGRPLDEIVLRSYCIGAAHMAWSWMRSESLTVDANGEVHDLTIRSFGIAKAEATPTIEVVIDSGDVRDPVNGSDAVFVAVAAAAWLASGCQQDWPIGFADIDG